MLYCSKEHIRWINKLKTKVASLIFYKKYHHWCECYPSVNRSLPRSRTTAVLFMSLLLLTPKLLKHHKNFSREKPFHLHYSIVQCGFSTNTFIVYWRCCQACDELIIPILMHATFSTEGVSEEGGGWGEERINTSKYVSSCHQQPTGSNLAADWLIRRLYEYPSRSVLHYSVQEKVRSIRGRRCQVLTLHCVLLPGRKLNVTPPLWEWGTVIKFD